MTEARVAPAGSSTDEIRLPDGTRLLHIGPPKTGTTSLQSALFAARPALLAQGVRHAGRARNSASAAQAITGRSSMFIGGEVPPISRWERLLHEVQHAPEPRVIISSEFFADAQPDAIRRIVDALDPDRIHVAVTVRPLASILTSQWAQYVADGMGAPFNSWLEAMLTPGNQRFSPSFWVRHRHDELVDRWAAVVGPERVTVVVVDSERGAVLRGFERLLGLTVGTLVADPDLANRSLTLPETEAVRAFNVQFKRAGLPRPLLSRVMHFGATRAMKRQAPDPAWPVIELPAWALPETARLAREIADGIARSGVARPRRPRRPRPGAGSARPRRPVRRARTAPGCGRDGDGRPVRHGHGPQRGRCRPGDPRGGARTRADLRPRRRGGDADAARGRPPARQPAWRQARVAQGARGRRERLAGRDRWHPARRPRRRVW